MSRILKRPMFRIGGPANEGIMSMAAPRRNYQGGTANPEVMKKYLENKAALREALGPGPSVRGDLSDLLISGGLNLLSGRGAGKGTLGSIAESYKEPYASFSKARAAEESLGRQIDLTAATGALSTIEAMETAKRKAESDFRLATLKSGTSMADKVEALTVKYLPDYQSDLNKAKNKATFDLITRDQIANKFGQTQIGGIIDVDFTDPYKVKQFVKSNKNKVGKIFYDLNTGEAKRLEIGDDGNFGFKVVDLTSNVVETPKAPIVTDSKTDKKVEDKKVVPSLPKLPPGSEEAFIQAEEERQKRIESLRSQGSKGDKRKELEAFDAKIKEINRERFGN
jgi:hypothetical protein